MLLVVVTRAAVAAAGVIVCKPLNVFAASVRATVKLASGKVTVLAAVGPLNVTTCENTGKVEAASGSV